MLFHSRAEFFVKKMKHLGSCIKRTLTALWSMKKIKRIT
ncbi:hypothetical protein SLEP1_g37285 [Rubroshorea leprosula]|uniref:Uncharacterized protein n=1 Tax=Rubroshorea leprosula TaxID=152421 RepID=A0AAV5KUC6_9ROSI|nr:hypothetical protein SLEP1_g37285 [Rubroshorea leprosula]